MRNIHLISASAGSGKTYSLTEKVLEAVQSGIAPERIMAVTFTNKAAAELKERMRDRLTENGDAKLLAQAGSLADAYIGTINSICARLLREFAFEAGDSPALDIMPEQEVTRLFRLSVARVIDSHYQSLAGAARRLGRDGSGSGYAQKPDWRDDVREIVAVARTNGLDHDAIRQMADASVVALRGHLGAVRDHLSSARMLQQVNTAVQSIEILEDNTAATKGARAILQQSRSPLADNNLPWDGWRKLATIAAGKRSGADDALDLVREYACQLQYHPDLHGDVETLIRGVFSCAAEALQVFSDYKRVNGLMDFADQESKVLQLLDRPHVQQTLAESVDLVLVDEFQDTSPIQLAMFSKLASLVAQNSWVGDQKQAIYGFRGTDPKLMDDVIAKLDKNQISVLETSWRSRPLLVAYTNALFVRALKGLIPAERVRLQPHRKDDSKQGNALRIWRLAGSNKKIRTSALAHGIAEMLKQPDQYQVEDQGRVRALQAGDIAVLSRSNETCKAIAEALAGYGIRASVGRGDLFTQPELMIALASLRLLADPSDRLALAELVNGLPNHASSDVWLTELAQYPEHAPARWKADNRICRLLAVTVVDQSPLELFGQVTNLMDLEDYAFTTTNPQQALANIAALATMIGDYQDSTKARHEAATLPGLICWLGQQDDPTMPEGRGEDTVQVLTYHRSKGLEWPLVILNDLDSKPRFSPFGVTVTAAEQFDPTDPLAGRGIRFWPEPFNGNDLPFGASIEESAEYAASERRETQERQRLMYVGMTRARDYLIHAVPYFTRKKGGDDDVHADWLDALIAGGKGIHIGKSKEPPSTIAVGDELFTCVYTDLREEGEPKLLDATAKAWFVPVEADALSYEPYRMSPSNHQLNEAQMAHVQTSVIADIGVSMTVQQGVKMNLLGDAMHRFIAADRVARAPEQRKQMAENILARWVPDATIDSAQLLAISEHFHHWVQQAYPDGRLLKEWPVRMKTDHRVAHGWIDALIETKHGFVLVDHKTIAADSEQCLEKVKKYAGQLDLYSQSIEAATGKKVLKTLIHLPLQGKIVSVETSSNDDTLRIAAQPRQACIANACIDKA